MKFYDESIIRMRFLSADTRFPVDRLQTDCRDLTPSPHKHTQVGITHWKTSQIVQFDGQPDANCHSRKVKGLVAQLCPTLCDPMDQNLSGSSVHGILQARKLEWVDILFSRGSSQSKIKLGLPLYRQILYHLSHQGNLNISDSAVNSGLTWLDFVISYFSMQHQCWDVHRPTLSTILLHNLKNIFSIVLEVYKNSNQKKILQKTRINTL